MGGEKHLQSFDYFDLVVDVSNEGNVSVALHDLDTDGGPGAGKRLLLMPWDEFRDVIEFVGIHGLGMTNPYVVEYADTVEGAEEAKQTNPPTARPT
jgi:hypothetical protein